MVDNNYRLNWTEFQQPNILGSYIAGRQARQQDEKAIYEAEQRSKLNSLQQRATSGDNSAIKELLLMNPDYAKLFSVQSKYVTGPNGQVMEQSSPSVWEGMGGSSVGMSDMMVRGQQQANQAPQQYELPQQYQGSQLEPVDVNAPVYTGNQQVPQNIDAYNMWRNSMMPNQPQMAQNIIGNPNAMAQQAMGALQGQAQDLTTNTGVNAAKTIQGVQGKAAELPANVMFEQAKSDIKQGLIKLDSGQKLVEDPNAEGGVRIVTLQGANIPEAQIKRLAAKSNNLAVVKSYENMMGLAEELQRRGAMVSEKNPTSENVLNYIKGLPVSQEIAQSIDPETQKYRNAFDAAKKELVLQIMSANELGTKMFDTPAEKKEFQDSLGRIGTSIEGLDLILGNKVKTSAAKAYGFDSKDLKVMEDLKLKPSELFEYKKMKEQSQPKNDQSSFWRDLGKELFNNSAMASDITNSDQTTGFNLDNSIQSQGLTPEQTKLLQMGINPYEDGVGSYNMQENRPTGTPPKNFTPRKPNTYK